MKRLCRVDNQVQRLFVCVCDVSKLNIVGTVTKNSVILTD